MYLYCFFMKLNNWNVLLLEMHSEDIGSSESCLTRNQLSSSCSSSPSPYSIIRSRPAKCSVSFKLTSRTP